MLCKNPYTFPAGNKNNVPAGFTVPCGDCVPCRVNRARFWIVRCYFEAMDWPQTLFITLTYSDDNLPSDGKLSTRDVQLFFKRYRKAIAPRKIRYFCAGEYGPKNNRPHYHAIIFNGGISDDKIIESSWGLGFVQVRPLSDINSVGYTCKYNLKSRRVRQDNELYPRLYVSRRPGIGHSALDFFKKIYNPELQFNSVIVDGKHYAIPPYYLRQFIREEERMEYMHKNAAYFIQNKEEYFKLIKGTVASIEARAKLKERMNI